MAPGRLKLRLAAWLGANKSSWWTSLHIFTNFDWDHLHFEDQSFSVVGSVPTKYSTCFFYRNVRLQGIIYGSGRLLHREQAFPSYALILGGGARKQLHDFEART